MNTPEVAKEGICVLVDGGCLNNNRPVSERSMYGSMTVFHNGKRVESSVYFGEKDARKCSKQVTHSMHFELSENGHASNQLAELYAMQEALQYVYALQIRSNRDLAITIMSDSEYALGHAQTFKPGKGANIDALTVSDELKRLATDCKKLGTTLSFQHVDNVWVKSVLGH